MEQKRQDNLIQDTLGRVNVAETRLDTLTDLTLKLQHDKAEDIFCKDNFAKLEQHARDTDSLVDTLNVHCTAIDNYLDKFQPLRVQAMINDHLNACLHSETRRKHKVYEDKKTSLLMKIILEDNGQSHKIQELIQEVTKMARITIEAQEREKRRKATMIEPSESVDDSRSMADFNEKGATVDFERIEDKAHYYENEEEMQAIAAKKEREEQEKKEAEEEKTALKKAKTIKGGGGGGNIGNLLDDPLFSNNNIMSLKELIKQDFEMGANDKDFKMTFE